MKIVILEPIGLSNEELEERLGPLSDHDIDMYDSIAKSPEEMIQRAQTADILVIANTPLTKEVIEACPSLKMISVAFVGIDHIAQDICKERNIIISNSANYCTHAVAELALGLTISVLRNIPRCDDATRALETKQGLVGHELYQKTFGLVGMGAIGCQVAKLALAFGCRVIAYNRSENPTMKALGVEYISLENLMSQSDIVSVHVPLTPDTRHLIAASQIDMMKPSAILINTARGPIVDQAYLAQALKANKIAGAGIDVFDQEPALTKDEALIYENTAVLTPHVAYATKESILRRGQIVIDNIIAYLEDKPQNVML